MAKITLVLLTDRPLTDGTCRVALQFAHRTRTAHHRLAISVPPSRWYGGHMIGNQHGDAVLQKMLADARVALHEVMAAVDISALSVRELRDRVLDLLLPREQPDGDGDRLLALFDRKIATLPRPRTREIYKTTRNKVASFCWAGADAVRVSELTTEWLRLFDLWMAEHGTPSRNARNIDLRNLRAVCNFAIDAGVATVYPFRRYRITPQDTPKRSLSVAQLRELATAELPPKQSEARDVFMLSFLLAGINPADLYELRATHGGRIQYTRKKTGKLYDLPVVDGAAALIERHRGASRLLATCERYSSARHFTAFCNGQLQRINLPALQGITLTMYWARHTWATVAAGLDIPTDTIAAALGHGSHTVTDIYIRRDASKVDEALRQVAGKLQASCRGK